MAQNVPEWLDKPFIAAALQGGEDKTPKVTVEDFSAVAAVAAGNNYSSQIFRVQVKYRSEGSSEQSKTLIIKAPHAQFQNMKELGLDGLYTKEPIMYSQVLPKMKEKIKHNFAAKTYYSKQKAALVLEDLKEAGYIMCDKFKQLDYAHCELVFKTMAKFHAASVVLHDENPEEIEKLGIEPIFTEGNPFVQMMKPMVVLTMGIVTEALKQTEDSEQTIEFLLNKEENFFERLIELCKPKKKGFNVVNHGDLWNCNMMFKHSDSGELEDIKFIDYQAIRYNTPAVDILYFTWTSADEEVREKRLQELYDIYLETLNDNLELLGCKQRYTLEELRQDLKAFIDFAVAVTCQTLPLMLCEEQDALVMSEFDMDQFMKMGNTGAVDPNMLRIYNGKCFKAKIPTILKQIHKLATSLSSK